MADERRVTDRTKCLIGGIVRPPGGVLSFNCVIREISPHGAKIAIDQTSLIPQGEFQLDLPSKNHVSYRAVCVWRRKSEAGLMFLEERRSPSLQLAEALARVTELEKEMDRLKQALQDPDKAEWNHHALISHVKASREPIASGEVD